MRLFFSSFHSLRPARTTSRLRKKADSRRDRDRGPFPLDFPVPQFCSANVARQIALYARMPRMQSTATSSFPWINADCCQASCRRRSEVIIECIRRRNTDIMRARIILLSVLLVCTSIRYAEGRTKKTQLSLQSKETNVVNFMRLLVMRLIFGVASAMGLGENLSGVLGGIFVPPGAEDYNDDYGDDDDLTSDLGVF